MAPLIDVRSEKEFDKGHIPGAVSLPLLNDHEYARVGTLYHKQGFGQAFRQALVFAGPKLAAFVDAIGQHAVKNEKTYVYCSRGGMRSGSMCWLFQQAGYRVEILPGGYKQYRSQVLTFFEHPFSLHVVTGLTGTGKTAHLKKLKGQGEQVIDLEAIAKHRGSAFGSLESPQPTQQQFENELFHALDTLDPKRPIWLEDESQMIGRCQIPNPFFNRMKRAPRTELKAPLEVRIRNIVSEYAPKNIEEESERIDQILHISKKLGLERTKCAIAAIRNHQFELAVSLILPYYDKTYRHSCRF